MSDEAKRDAGIGSLGSCLIDGDTEQKSRERTVKWRALGISVVLQTVMVMAILLTPMFAQTEKISTMIYVPMPPYRASAPVRRTTEQHIQTQQQRNRTSLFQPANISPTISTRDTPSEANMRLSEASIDIGTISDTAGLRDGLDLPDSRRGPTPPEDPEKRKKRIVQGGAVQQAMLIHRVEPQYPALAKQIRKSGQVQLHAIISMDGSIGSLQAISGDPLLLQSALEAVRQWKYRPTYLNGQPVEVETIITVVYTLQQ